MSAEDAVDYLKFAAALIVVAQSEFRALHDNNPALAAEALLARLHHVHAEMSDAAGRFCPDGQSEGTWLTRYSDGRPVMSAMPMDGGCYAHAWHPDRTHPMNNRCEELDVITTPEGTRKRIVVSAAGFLDAVTLTQTPGAGDGQPALAQTE
jgi:hypothetical protein